MAGSYFNDFFRFNWNKKKMKKIFLYTPIVSIVFICIFLLVFLIQGKDPTKPPSALLNEDLPKFSLINLFNKNQFLSDQNLDGKVFLINFFASWCAPCKVEHPLFFEIKEEYPNLFILGVDMQDIEEDAIKYLKNDGNPYDYVGFDKYGSVAIEFGVVGLPETFLINSSGKIIYKHLGPLTREIIKNDIKPLL